MRGIFGRICRAWKCGWAIAGKTTGILNLVSGQGDPLMRFEPDTISQGDPPVNWSGDGEELLYLYSSGGGLRLL